MTQPTKIALSRIRTDGGTQPRAAMNEETIADYAEAIEAGTKFPPVVVFHDGEVYWLADGFHRVAATKRLGCLDIDADVRAGTRRDAQLFSFGANATHGLRRTNADKRRAVLAMLADPDWAQWSDREIARVACVSRFLVATLRQELAPESGRHLAEMPDRSSANLDSTRRVVRGDTEYEMAVGGINAERPRAETAPAAPPVSAAPATVAPAEPADPDENLEREIAKVEAELGIDGDEVEALRAQLATANEKIAELASEVEWLSRALDTSAAEELKKQAVYIRTVESNRNDVLMQNAQLKKHCAQLERQLQRLQREAGGGQAA